MSRHVKKFFALTFFCLIAGAAFADICLVPVVDGTSLCDSEATPCTTLRNNDLLAYPTSHDDGDTTKISIMHQQSAIASPASIIMDLCFEPAAAVAVGGMNINLTPSADMITTTIDCDFECATWATNAAACAGWHEMNRYDSTLKIGEVCTAANAAISYFSEPAGTADPNASMTTGNIILARITFTGVNKAAATLAATCVDDLCGVTAANIANVATIETDTEVDKYSDLAVVTGTSRPTEIQVIPTQCTTYAATAASSNKISCVAESTDPAVCGVTNNNGEITLNWTATSPACTSATGCTVTYDVYDGSDNTGTKVCNGVSATTCDVTAANAIGNNKQYAIYAKTTECGTASTPVTTGYSVTCSCRSVTMTQTLINDTDINSVTTIKPSISSAITVEGTITDDLADYDGLTVIAYVGCTTACPGGGGTFAAPQEIVICSPTTTACSSTFSGSIPATVFAFDDADSAQDMRIAVEVQVDGSPLAALPSAFTGTLDCVGCTNAEIQAENWQFSDHLVFKSDENPYPSALPFMPTIQNALCLNFELIDDAAVVLRIYNPDGTLMRILEDKPDSGQDDCDELENNTCNWKVGCKWDGTSYLSSGDFVANGLYILHLYAVGTADSNYSGNIVEMTRGIVVMK